MKRSIYNRAVDLERNCVAVYNTLTGALCVFEKSEYEHFFINDINELTLDEQKDMEKKTFFVSEECDELSKVLFKRNNAILNGSVPTYRILVTTACNARCPYCFEQGIKYKSMDTCVADALVDFILKMSEDSPQIKVQWFGGEPLMNIDIIKYITNKLEKEYKGTVLYSIITNGSLLTRDVAQTLLNLGVKRVQITLDGDKAIYEARKNYVDKSNIFEKVIDNIKTALEEGLAVIVRLNYDKSTIDSIMGLVDMLGVKFGEFARFSCYPYPIYGTYNSSSVQSTNKTDLLALHTKIMQTGIVDSTRLARSVLNVKNGPCMAYSAKSFFISPDGLLYKCSIDMKNNVGDVFNGIKYNSTFFKWCNLHMKKECIECDLLPVCQGGCRAGALDELPVKCMRDKDVIDDIIKLMVSNSNC